ncbi:hypothetical protein KP509_10G043800 [Ceratopteris richardii]|nr:hypothetical protein KP509_10G043800 [Ceratopteris richardii]
MPVVSYEQVKVLCKQKRLKDALQCIFSAHRQGFQILPDSIAETLLLCAHMKTIEEGRELHELVREKHVKPNRYLNNNLLNMYLKCGSLDEGKQVFEEMLIRDVVSWNAMIAGYVKSGYACQAVELFWRMQQESIEPNEKTFICVLMACAPPVSIEEAALIHTFLSMYSFESDIHVGNALIGMYLNFRLLNDAYFVFKHMTMKDVVMWTSMITGYSDNGRWDEALNLFQRMLQESVIPDEVIFLSVLSACASLYSLRFGLMVHSIIINAGIDLNPFIGSSLINMYAKCGNLHLVHRVFEQIPFKDTVLWTAIVSGYEQQSEYGKALQVFDDMLATSINPNEFTFVSVLNACTGVASLDLGMIVYSNIVESGIECNMHIASALIDMYGKCGNEEDMCAVFVCLPITDTVVWNAIIDGLAQHGNSESTFQYFKQMKHHGLEVDSMTFVGLLSACNHAGLVDEGLYYFYSMLVDDEIKPSIEVYVCLIDILGRAGQLESAYALTWKLPLEYSMSLYTPLLSSCRIHSNLDVATRVGESMIKLHPQRESTYVLLSNVHALKPMRAALGTFDFDS